MPSLASHLMHMLPMAFTSRHWQTHVQSYSYTHPSSLHALLVGGSRACTVDCTRRRRKKERSLPRSAVALVTTTATAAAALRSVTAMVPNGGLPAGGTRPWHCKCPRLYRLGWGLPFPSSHAHLISSSFDNVQGGSNFVVNVDGWFGPTCGDAARPTSQVQRLPLDTRGAEEYSFLFQCLVHWLCMTWTHLAFLNG
jgi:hypothetical protein